MSVIFADYKSIISCPLTLRYIKNTSFSKFLKVYKLAQVDANALQERHVELLVVFRKALPLGSWILLFQLL